MEADLEYNDFWPNTTLEVDWDLRKEIKETILSLGCPLEVFHVKGHQDNKVAQDELSITARLNVRADELAGNYWKWNNQSRPTVPRLGSNKAQLIINDSTINGHYRSEIRNAASSGDLKEYTMSKFHWTSEQYESINWDAFGSAVSATKQRADQITKLVFDWAPTNTLLHKYDPSVSPLCPHCHNEEESVTHVIRCRHQEPKKIRSILIKNLRSRCYTLCTKPLLVQILVKGLEAWFDGTILEWSAYPMEAQILIKNQTMVGWDQLFRGRFVSDWARLQDCYLGSLPKSKKKKSLSGLRWTVSMIRIVWTHYFELWELRNKAVHGSDSKESLSRIKQKLLLELKLVHADRLKYLTSDRKFLIAETEEDSHKLEEYVAFHYPSTIRNWLDWHVPLLRASIQEAQAKAVSFVRPITEYFSKIIQPVNEAPTVLFRKPQPKSKVTNRPSRSITEFFGPKKAS